MTSKQHQESQLTSEEATAQLKTQLSNFFGFFSKVTTDISATSSNLKNPIALIEAKRANKTTEKSKATETPEKAEKTEKPTTPVPAVKDTVVEKPKSKQKDGSKSQRAPALKEGTIHIDPPVEKKEKPKTPPVNKYNSFKDLFGSIGKFISQTADGLQSGSSKAYEKVQSGLDLNEKIKNGLTMKKKEEKVVKKETKDAEARKSALDTAAKKRLEEAKRMKENFEKQLRSLDEEILMLQQGDEPNAEDGTHRSREKKDKKAFRINSQKSGRELSEKNNSATISATESKPNIPKAKKMLNPLDEAKLPGRKLQEGSEKSLKSVASQPLYLRMEKEFQQNVVFAELEARKEKLKMKREFYKPMDDKELREHALKYEERKKAMAHSEEKVSVPLNFAKSQTYKKVLEKEKEEKIKSEQKVGEKKQLKDKQQQYAKLVKEMFFPKVEKDDLLSKENLQDIIARSQKAELPAMAVTAKDSTNTNNMRVPLRRKRTSQDISQPAAEIQQSPERGYVQPYSHKEFLRKNANQKVKVAQPVLKNEKLKEHVLDFETKRGDTEEEEVVEVKPKKKSENKGKPRMVSMSPRRKVSENDKKDSETTKKDTVLTEEPEVVKKSYPNYLAEIRQKRVEQGVKKYGQWEKIMKSKGLSQQEKVANIMTDIDRMERQAKMKEYRIKNQKEHEPVDLEDEVGEMYLESIKAKLAIIKDLA